MRPGAANAIRQRPNAPAVQGRHRRRSAHGCTRERFTERPIASQATGSTQTGVLYHAAHDHDSRSPCAAPECAHRESDGAYGTPRVTSGLRDAGEQVNHKRVARQALPPRP
ncbi:IS3 family transposase [Streptomyces sp. NPDC014940]|uniref:IS3 family transposase n=1 Tax=Streptomyces sp. NPDC014940 TaxID=3364932 RepID=UPI0036FB7F57